MIPIGILNLHASNCNYGAVLQAFAMQVCIKEIGYTSENIDLIPPVSEDTLIEKVFKFAKYCLKVILGKGYIISENKVFEEFRKKYLHRTTEKFYTVDSLHNYQFTYKAVIVGSDQVWRPNYTRNCAMAYFLPFINDNTIKIAYAASFGTDTWLYSPDFIRTDIVKKLLKRFKSISVREDSGVAICKNIFNVQATHVLDPVLLIGDRLLECFRITNAADHIAYYTFNESSDFKKAVNLLEKTFSLPSTNLYHEILSTRYRRYRSVEDWITGIARSKYIITESFHCICLAILYRKQFICFENSNRGISRIKSLLNDLGIGQRIICCFDSEGIQKLIAEKIDYDEVYDSLSRLRVESFRFLKNSLAGL